MRRRRSLLANLARLGLESCTVIAQRSMLAARRAPGSAREATRAVAEKPAAFMAASASACTAATFALLTRPLDPAGAWGKAGSAWTRTLTSRAHANRKRLSRRR